MLGLGMATLASGAPSMEYGAGMGAMGMEQSYPEHLIINNRVLIKIHDKVITVMDVVKKMDLLFYKQYPTLASSNVARYQFYSSGWKTVLGMVIDDFLIMADAEEKEVKVTDGEVREELEALFGPDVVINLDKLGMTLEEAFELLKTDLTVQRMISIMVRNRAMVDVYPLSVRRRYERILAENPIQNVWVYSVLAVRGKEHERVAHEAHRLIHEQGVPFEKVMAQLQNEGVELAYSPEYRQKEKELSLSYRAVLQTLSAGASSAPIAAKNVSRLFCLKGIEREGPGTLNAMAEELKRELTEEAMEKYNHEYRKRLRKNYGITEKYLSYFIPSDLKPFDLR